METEQLLMYIGMGVIVVFAIYFVLKMGSLQTRVIEGLTSKSKQKTSFWDSITTGDIKALKAGNEKMADTLLISKYKTDYEDMLIDYETAIDNNILGWLISFSGLINKDGMINVSVTNKDSGPSVLSPDKINLLNGLYTLKNNLNSTMEFLDGHNSSGGSANKSGSLF
jgi:hypothetical protein